MSRAWPPQRRLLLGETGDADSAVGVVDRSRQQPRGWSKASCSADSDRFMLSRSMAPALVRQADILTFDLDANEVSGGCRTP